MTMASTTKKRMTAEEFADFVLLPENEGRSFELVKGEVVEMSRAGGLHCLVCSNINFLLSAYVRQRKQGTVFSNDPGLLLERDPDTVRGPDVAYFATSSKYAEVNPKWIEETPTLAVEVLSPNDRPGKVNRKVADYLASGVKMVCVVDPEECNVAVHRPNTTLVTLDRAQEFDGGDTLPGFRCHVSEFFYSSGDETV
jgi:Uma2 family endonuclease